MSATESREQVEREARNRLYPSLCNPNYLVLRQRRLHFTAWLGELDANLRVLDIGGRIQPYRPLLEGKARQYIALDVADSPLVDVRADACALPYADATFDLVFCTQVLELVPNAAAATAEIHRVLRTGGVALLSFAAHAPRFSDDEYARYFPPGIRGLLAPFREVQILAEGSSISGCFRSTALCLCMFARFTWLRRLVTRTAVPGLNLGALLLERVAHTTNHQATGNYSVRARK
jgi:SAM-dependent methyltransferase